MTNKPNDTHADAAVPTEKPWPELLGTLIQNGGGETLLIPEAELLAVDRIFHADPQEQTSKEFSWSDRSVIVPEQQAVAAYFNDKGNLVIRQERSWDRDEDSFIFIDRANADGFLDKLSDLLGYGAAGRS